MFKIEEIIFKTKNLVFNDSIHFPNINIPKNKVTFIVGKSGAGKTTLLKMFNGTLTQSNGDIFYNNTNILDIETIKLRKEVLLISQTVFLFDGTIRDNFKEFYSYRQEKALENSKIKLFLDICHLDFSLEKNCNEMSGGEKQRLYIAIYLSFKPKVIMLDEPTSALDEENSHEIIKNILSFSKENGITVIIVSHDKKLSEVFADNTVLIE
ncbi:MAG: ABC transporter ATP-binding protein [Methanobrevibacter sp.]|nr:ABC transporter ATP-binding protein [Methanobrevibacter sp.]